MSNQFDITKHKWSDSDVCDSFIEEGKIYLCGDYATKTINEDDAIAIARCALYHMAKSDVDRSNLIDKMLSGICFHCGEITDRCHCMNDE